MTATPELSRLVSLDRLGARWIDVEVVATADELAAVAARLGVPSVAALSCTFRLRRDAADPATVLAEATLSAHLEQICVVTLEPFAATATEEFRLRFIPTSRDATDEDPDSDDELMYENGVIDVGEAAVEQMALALDPFPRAPGAILPDLDEPSEVGPFAALAGRRRPQ